MRLTIWTQRLLAVVFIGLAAICGIIEATHWQYKEKGNSDDMHGGVPMGIPNDNCDNGQDRLWVDYDGAEEDYLCPGLHWVSNTNVNARNEAPFSSCQTTDLDPPLHVCMHQVIEYRDPIPTNGAHRPLWAKYGEYQYLPKQRWLHNLEHGAAVFLYHPCADPTEEAELKRIARSCLWKHIITPFRELSRETPFAVLTYGCKLILPRVDDALIKEFLQDHALNAPESSNDEDGQFDDRLFVPARHLLHYEDRSTICQ
ncbi:uncharacterized protein [Asterias amurensis]|uniref:uncharacterized protein n=1 Tax=Asterias amurensis TaxID=7602 RepID=UPI003AB6D8EA